MRTRSNEFKFKTIVLLVKQLEACHEKQMIVECPLGKKIVILKAAYGIYSNANSCGYKQKNGKCVSDMTLEVCIVMIYRILIAVLSEPESKAYSIFKWSLRIISTIIWLT